MAVVLFSSRMKEEKLKGGLNLIWKYLGWLKILMPCSRRLAPRQHSGWKDYTPPCARGRSQPVQWNYQITFYSLSKIRAQWMWEHSGVLFLQAIWECWYYSQPPQPVWEEEKCPYLLICGLRNFPCLVSSPPEIPPGKQSSQEPQPRRSFPTPRLRHRETPRQPAKYLSPFNQERIHISSLCYASYAGLLTAVLSPGFIDVVI